MTLVLLLIHQGRTSGGHGLLEAVPRIYQVTPDLPDRRRATKQKEVRPSPADSLNESQLAARSGPSPRRRTTPTAESKQQASKRKRAGDDPRCQGEARGAVYHRRTLLMDRAVAEDVVNAAARGVRQRPRSRS